MNKSKNPPTVLTFLLIGIVVVSLLIVLNLYNTSRKKKAAEEEAQRIQQEQMQSAAVSEESEKYIPDEYKLDSGADNGAEPEPGAISVTYAIVDENDIKDGDDYVTEVKLPDGDVRQGSFVRSNYTFYLGSDELINNGISSSGDGTIEFSDNMNEHRYHLKASEADGDYAVNLDQVLSRVLPYEQANLSDNMFMLSYEVRFEEIGIAPNKASGDDTVAATQMSEEHFEQGYSDGTFTMDSSEPQEQGAVGNAQKAMLGKMDSVRLAIFIIVLLVTVIILIVSDWKIFDKAGVPGWMSLIPFLNTWKLYEIVWGNGAISLLSYIGPLFFPITIILYIKMTKSFGKQPIFILLLLFLPVVAFPILAFSDDGYLGPADMVGVKEE